MKKHTKKLGRPAKKLPKPAKKAVKASKKRGLYKTKAKVAVKSKQATKAAKAPKTTKVIKPKQLHSAMNMYAQGHSLAFIAKQLGVTPESVIATECTLTNMLSTYGMQRKPELDDMPKALEVPELVNDLQAIKLMLKNMASDLHAIVEKL